jgi:hypothetical protein
MILKLSCIKRKTGISLKSVVKYYKRRWYYADVDFNMACIINGVTAFSYLYGYSRNELSQKRNCRQLESNERCLEALKNKAPKFDGFGNPICY